MSVTCSACSHDYAETALFCPNCGRPKARSTTKDALVGSILGERFQVQGLVGQGASGTIYRAEHTTLRRRVAIKVLHDELSRDDLAVERFRREATTVADIDNEHIVEIHDFGRTPDGRLYLAMELLEGETLDAVLVRDKQLSVERTADILIQVGEALAEAHAIGYVHRDLRPRNLFLTQRRGKANFVKLLDFGLAKLVESDSAVASTNLGMTFGDPRYMSPEQARGERIDRRADIYQLGCVAYEMLTGAPPFAGSRVFEILTKQVSDAPRPLPTARPGVPLWMEAAVAKMLAKDPDNRFATTTRMVDALRRGLETGEVMEDSVARRKESVPPPSVSRVMAKFGMQDGAEPTAAPAPAPAVSTAPPAMPDSIELLRKRTGTPKVGVPAYDDSSSSLPASSSSSSVSKPDKDDDGWYDEDPGASRAGMSYDDLDKPATSRRWGLYAVILGTLLLVGGGAFALSRSADSPQAEEKKPDPVAAPALLIDAAPAAIIEPGSGSASQIATTPGTTPTKKPSTGDRPRNPSTASNTPTTRPPVTPQTGAHIPPSSPGNPFPFPVLGSDDPPTQPPITNPTNTPPVVSPPVNTPTTPYDEGDEGDEGDDQGVNGDPEDPYGGGGNGNSSRVAPPITPTASTPADTLASTGAQQLADGDTSGAASSFKQALEADPSNFTARIGMGEIALRQGLFGDAIAHLKKATKLSSRSSRAFTLLGEAYLNSGNTSAAETAFKKALQLDPDNSRARDGFNDAQSR